MYGLLYRKAIGLEGKVFALNGVADHIHMVVAIPPKIAVATFIGQVKGVASARYNKESGASVALYWQAEYGAFSFDAKRLPNYIAYVERQKEHHAHKTIIPILERMDDGAVKIARDATAIYVADDAMWRRELESLGVDGE